MKTSLVVVLVWLAGGCDAPGVSGSDPGGPDLGRPAAVVGSGAVVFGAPARWQLSFGVAPSSVSSGGYIAPAIEVRVVDLDGARAAGEITITLALAGDPSGVTLAGTLTGKATAGVASFPEIAIDKAGDYRLVATAAGVAPATSDSFAVTAGAPAQLRFVTGPSSTPAGSPIAAVRVELEDVAGNRVGGASDPILIGLAANPSGATLSGTLAVTPVDGVATFADLRLDLPGRGYSLDVFSGALVPRLSAPFDVQ